MQVDDGRIPLVIGTTGHRDPADGEHVCSQVRQILKELADKAPSVPFCVMTPLATGGDRLVAKAALDFRETRRRTAQFAGTANGGVELIAVLPLQLDDYKLDFRDGKDLEEFSRCLAQMDRVLELPIHEGARFVEVVRDGRTVRAVDGGEFERDRNEAFERLGRFTALHSHVLIALWNGWNTAVKGPHRSGIGGTHDVIRFCRTRNAGDKVGGVPLHSEISPILQSPRTPVAWVFTARKSDAEKGRRDLRGALQQHVKLTDHSGVFERMVAARRWLGAPETDAVDSSLELGDCIDNITEDELEGERESFQRLLASLAALNRELDTGSSSLREGVRPLLSEDHGLSRLVTIFERLDSTAIRAKRRFDRNALRALVCLIAAILVFQVFSSWSYSWFMMGYLALLGVVVLWRRSVKRNEWDRAETRCLAEVARVQIACRSVGNPKLVSDFFDERRVQQTTQLCMLARGILCYAALPIPRLPEPYSRARLEVMRSAFVGPQATWRSRSAMESRRRAAARSDAVLGWAKGMIIITAVFALAAALIQEQGWLGAASWSPMIQQHLLPVLNLAAGASLTFVLFLEESRSLFRTREELEAADCTYPLYETALEQIAKSDSPETVRAATTRICDAALDEQIEWYVARRDSAQLETLG